MAIQFLPSLASLIPQYDGFILDLWGVIHDGQKLYPGAKESLEKLRAAGKKIVFLSNAPRRASVVKEMLARMGVTENLYDKIVTSGEAAYECLAHPGSSFFKPRGKHYFYIGLEKDRTVLSGLHYEEAEHPKFADFLLLSHSYVDNQPMSELMPLLKESLEANLPALCINPDSEVVRQSGERVMCAGVIAREYHMMGGEVIYFGKPHRAVYEVCMHALGDMQKKRILAVGDSLQNDIQGALNNGLASVLVTGGILEKTVGKNGDQNYQASCLKIFEEESVSPDYVVPDFTW